MQIVKLRCRRARDKIVAGTADNVRSKLIGHRDLALGLFTERYAQGVADTVGQESTDAGSALYASIFALTGFGDAEVQGIVHPLGLHGVAKQAHRTDHDGGIAGLDGDDHIGEVLALTDAQKLHAAFDDALGGVAITAHDAVGKRTVVHTDAQRRVVRTADGKQPAKPCLKAGKLGSILLVGIGQMFELPRRVDVVTGIDAHLFDDGCCDVGHVWIEVHVSHEGAVVACLVKAAANLAQVLGLARTLCGEAYVVCAGIEYAFALCDAGFSVHGRGGRHALQAERLVAAQRTVADVYLVGMAGLIVEERHGGTDGGSTAQFVL